MQTPLKNRQIQHIEDFKGFWQQKILQEVLKPALKCNKNTWRKNHETYFGILELGKTEFVKQRSYNEASCVVYKGSLSVLER